MAKQVKYGRYLHGGDYNPEQWLDRPDILQKDIEYFKKAHINTVSVGIFSWAVLEPEEGKYNFDWLEEIINNLYKEGIHTILATPSGARPKWMADKYEEVLRMDPDRTRRFFGGRHNHCFTSPVYREKVHAICTEMDHNSVLRPLYLLEKEGLDLTILPADRKGMISLTELESSIRPETRAIICTHASNLTGMISVRSVRSQKNIKNFLFWMLHRQQESFRFP